MGYRWPTLNLTYFYRKRHSITWWVSDFFFFYTLLNWWKSWVESKEFFCSVLNYSFVVNLFFHPYFNDHMEFSLGCICCYSIFWKYLSISLNLNSISQVFQLNISSVSWEVFSTKFLYTRFSTDFFSMIFFSGKSIKFYGYVAFFLSKLWIPLSLNHFSMYLAQVLTKN